MFLVIGKERKERREKKLKEKGGKRNFIYFVLFFYKYAQTLIFINVGVYVGSMSYFLILNPYKVKEFLKVKEHLLRAMVKEPPRANKRGRRRIA